MKPFNIAIFWKLERCRFQSWRITLENARRVSDGMRVTVGSEDQKKYSLHLQSISFLIAE